jgi:ferric-dicitrate binding protein FerR (iron transport regulator)
MSPAELETRIQQLLDGDLHPEHWPELRDRLSTCEEARRIYSEHARVHSQLLRIRRERSALPPSVVPVERMLDFQRRRQLRVAGFAAAAVIFLSAVAMHLILAKGRDRTVQVASVAGTRFEVMEPGAARTGSATEIREGSRLTLEQGVLELTFQSGVRAVVRAPADFTVASPAELAMDEGVAWFSVPKDAAGFRVRTPRVTVTDLGTEFGVVSKPDAVESVHLFKGSVRIDCHAGFRESATLTGSGAREVTPTGRLLATQVRLDRFFTKLPDHLPWIGWSFDESAPADWRAEGTMPEAATARSRVMPEGNGIIARAGRFGGALGGTGGNAWWESNWQGVAGNAPRTVAFWLLLPPGEDYLHPIVGWGLRSGGSSGALDSFYASVETVDGRTVVGASLGGYWLKGTTAIDDGRWHHIALLFSGRTLPDGTPDLRIMIDGRAEPVRPAFIHEDADYSPARPLLARTNTTHPESQPLSVLSHLFIDRRGDHPFEAAIDELRVYEAELDSARIESLHRHNRLPGPAFSSDQRSKN